VDALRRDAAAVEGGAIVRSGALLATLIASAAVALPACGSEEANPPSAEPAESPPLTVDPAGDVRSDEDEAEGVVVDGKTGLAAVAYRDTKRIDLVDVATNKVVRTFGVPEEARHLELARPGGPLLVPVEYKDRLLRVDLPSGRILTDVEVGDFPHDAVQAANGRIFVGDEGGDTVSVLERDQLTDTLPAPQQPGGVATSGHVVAVVAVAAREMAFYDTGTLEQTAVLPGGAGPSHVVAGDDGRFYVADTGGDAILVYEGGDDPRLLDRTNVPGSPYGLAIDNRRGELWVTQTARNEVSKLQLTDTAPKIVASYPTVRQPNGVGVDDRTGRVVVVSRDDGDVQIFDPAEEDGGG
jgi:DNA-binding beta-propeller fold protein YncE